VLEEKAAQSSGCPIQNNTMANEYGFAGNGSGKA
jgi:hypothetical protein